MIQALTLKEVHVVPNARLMINNEAKGCIYFQRPVHLGQSRLWSSPGLHHKIMKHSLNMLVLFVVSFNDQS